MHALSVKVCSAHSTGQCTVPGMLVPHMYTAWFLLGATCVCVHVPVCVVGSVPGPLQGVCTATRRAAACSSLAGEGACETRPWLLAMH